MIKSTVFCNKGQTVSLLHNQRAILSLQKKTSKNSQVLFPIVGILGDFGQFVTFLHHLKNIRKIDKIKKKNINIIIMTMIQEIAWRY